MAKTPTPLLPDRLPKWSERLSRAAVNALPIPGVLAVVIAISMWFVINNMFPANSVALQVLNIIACLLIAFAMFGVASWLLLTMDAKLIEEADEEYGLPEVYTMGLTKGSKTAGIIFTTFVGFFALVFAGLWSMFGTTRSQNLLGWTDWVYFGVLITLIVLVVVFLKRSNGPAIESEWLLIDSRRQQKRQQIKQQQQGTPAPTSTPPAGKIQIIKKEVPSMPAPGYIFPLHILDTSWADQWVTIVFVEPPPAKNILGGFTYHIPSTVTGGQQIDVTYNP